MSENNRLFEVTMQLCQMCFTGKGGECHHPCCALNRNRAPDLTLQGNPLVKVVRSWEVEAPKSHKASK